MAYAGLPLLYARRLRRALAARCRAARTVALTFDDGPGPRLTPRLLDLLDRHGVPATFFVLTRNAVRYPALLQQLIARGHAIGCHGHDHVHPWRSAPWKTVADLARARAELSRLLGSNGSRLLLRPPYGKLNLLSLLWVWWRRARIATWTVDGGDTWRRPPDEAAAQLRAGGGGVLLLHDFDRDDPAVDERVLACVESTLALAGEGFRFATLDSVLRPS